MSIGRERGLEEHFYMLGMSSVLNHRLGGVSCFRVVGYGETVKSFPHVLEAGAISNEQHI